MEKLSVILINTSDMTLESILNSSFLSSEDLLYLERYKLEETKKEKAVSLILKKKYIKDYDLNEHGKPISEHTYFNISHSHGVVVFTKNTLPVGIDIEKIRPVNKDLIDYISNKEEKEYITSEVRFYEIWTTKESLTKCVGTGINEKVSNIPGLPINGLRQYKGKEYRSVTRQLQDYIVTITRESTSPFEIDIVEESIILAN